MPINLNYYVPQGRYGITSNRNLNFGTDGLGTCVAIMVQLSNGNNFCGHMDHSYEPTRQQQQQFITQVCRVLQDTILPLGNIAAVHYCTPGGTRAAQFTVEAIQQQFPNAQSIGNFSCLYIDTTGIQGTNQNVSLGQPVDNGAFSV